MGMHLGDPKEELTENILYFIFWKKFKKIRLDCLIAAVQVLLLVSQILFIFMTKSIFDLTWKMFRNKMIV